MVQREVGERLVAEPAGKAYGAVSVRVAYRAEARILRRVPAEVFWPRPKVDSVLVRMAPTPPPSAGDREPWSALGTGALAERGRPWPTPLRRPASPPDRGPA